MLRGLEGWQDEVVLIVTHIYTRPLKGIMCVSVSREVACVCDRKAKKKEPKKKRRTSSVG